MSFRAPDREGFARREKLGPLLLTIALHLILLAVLFLYKGAPIPKRFEDSLNTFFVPDSGEDKAEQAEAKATEQPKAKDSERAREQPAPKPPVEPPVVPEPPPIPIGPSWLTMSSSEFAASDISKMQRAQKGAADSGPSADSKSAYGPGEGPGGVRLYEPDWYREPTNAELAGYLPSNAPRSGWGLVACQTIANYHVDNCQTLGESPLGSGFGRAVRQAAWQFLVLPPRINGKPVIGAWVRIRISYGETVGPG